MPSFPRLSVERQHPDLEACARRPSCPSAREPVNAMPLDRGKPRHHRGRGGGASVDGTFENHVVSKTCLAIC
jgi:hypothetical protein